MNIRPGNVVIASAMGCILLAAFSLAGGFGAVPAFAASSACASAFLKLV